MNIGGTEIFLILVVALLLFGAKNLPKIARGLGKSVEEFRRAAREVSHEVMTADADDEPPRPKQISGGEQVASGNPGGEPAVDADPAAGMESGAVAEPPAAAEPPPGGEQVAQKEPPHGQGSG